MIFPLHNTTAWWRHVAANLTFSSATIVVGEGPDADICIAPRFYRAFHTLDTTRAALDAFGAEGCAEIAARCRFLRILDSTLALRMIGAMWHVFTSIVDEEMPDIVLSSCVDRYLLDVFERICRRRGIPYVGLAVSPLPDQIMFMAKGEYLPVREPSEAEIEDAVKTVTDPKFRPTYLPKIARHSLARFLTLYARFTARWLVFEVLQKLERNPLDFRYRSTRRTEPGFRVRLKDWGTMKYLDPSWEQALEDAPFDRRVFLALAVTPEAAIDYWVDDLGLIQHEALFERAARAFTAAGFRVFVKDHPSQFGFRRVEQVQRLAEIAGVTIVPYEVRGETMIDRCKTTFTLTGTVGFQAALAGRCAIAAATAYYICDGYYTVLKTPDDIDRLPDLVDAFVPPVDLAAARRALMLLLLRASMPGKLTWLKWSARVPGAVDATRPLLRSLNEYLPQLLRKAPSVLAYRSEDVLNAGHVVQAGR